MGYTDNNYSMYNYYSHFLSYIHTYIHVFFQRLIHYIILKDFFKLCNNFIKNSFLFNYHLNDSLVPVSETP